MLDLYCSRLTRTRIRHALALSLLTQRPFRLAEGYNFILGDEAFQAVISDWEDILHRMDAGRISHEGGNMIFLPAPLSYGNYSFAANPWSSSAEIVLLLLPALSSLKYRSSLSIEGVTHAGISYGSDFIRETLLGFLERMGFYAGYSLKRFGFYGTGGGNTDTRIFPAEKRSAGDLAARVPVSLSGARVYISKLDASAALMQKELFSGLLDIPSEKIGIIEVRDSDGSGNFIQAHFEYAGGMSPYGSESIVLSRILDIYNCRGRIVFDEEDAKKSIADFAVECGDFISTGRVPDYIIEELAPYALLTGSALPDGADTRETARMLEAFL